MSRSEADITIVEARTGEDRGRWIAVQHEVSPCSPFGPDSIEHWWTHVAEGYSALACRGERVVGILRVERPDWVPDARHADTWIMVVADERRRGIGTALADAAGAWADQHMLEGLHVIINEAAGDAMTFWARRGFVEVGRDQRSRLELATPPALITPPPGVTLVTLADQPGLLEGMYRVATEAFPDIPGADAYSAGDFDHWLDGDVHVPGLLPECSVIACAENEVVGYALLVRDQVRPGVATHEMTAVLRAWRGRGVSRAMKVHQLRLGFSAGFNVFETENEARNAPMLSVNTRLGYLPLPCEVTVRGTWPPRLSPI